jgi:acetyl/propionyl-CoA carboxylase alpha subunit
MPSPENRQKIGYPVILKASPGGGEGVHAARSAQLEEKVGMAQKKQGGLRRPPSIWKNMASAHHIEIRLWPIKRRRCRSGERECSIEKYRNSSKNPSPSWTRG